MKEIEEARYRKKEIKRKRDSLQKEKGREKK